MDIPKKQLEVGENTIRSQNWYEFQYPQKVLKSYKILEYLKIL